MSQDKNIFRLSITLIIALSFLLVGFWGLKMFSLKYQNTSKKLVLDTKNSNINTLDNLTSVGEKILVPQELPLSSNKPGFQTAKEQGIQAIDQKNYQLAVQHFKEALTIAPNAPETRIYMNNAQIGEARSYTIAVVVPINRKVKQYPTTALEMLRGFAQAQYEINRKGGIHNKQIKLQIIDDEDNPETAKKIAEKLLQEKKVIGVMGHQLSEVSLAVAPIYANGKLVFITPISTSSDLNSQNKASNNGQRYVFRTNIDTEIAAQNIARHIHDTFDVHKVAIFYDGSQDQQDIQDFREKFTKTLVNTYRGTIVYKDDLSKGDSHYPAKERYTEALHKGAQALLLLPSSKTVNNALEVVSEKFKNPNQSESIQVLGELSNLYNNNTLNRGKDATGMVLAVGSYLTDKDPFSQSAKALWQDKIEAWQTANSYDAVQVFIEALKRNPQADMLAKEICKDGFKATGASGDPLTFNCLDSGSPEKRLKLVRVSPSEDSSDKNYYFKQFYPTTR